MFQTLERFRKEMQVVIYHAHLYNAIVVIQIHTLCGGVVLPSPSRGSAMP